MLFDAIRNGTNYKKYVNGAWQATQTTIPILSPIDGAELGGMPAMTRTEVDDAIASCVAAQKPWARKSLYERGDILLQGAQLLRANAPEIADLLTREIAKDHKSCLLEVTRTADLIQATVEQGKALVGEVVQGGVLDADTRHKTALVTRVPYGVVLAVSPFNYPINLAASKIAPALLMGNSVAFKPSTQGSLSALHLVRCLEQGGLPAGVLCTITGEGSVVGPHMMAHPDIALINFTGSTGVGQKIAKGSGMIPLVMELGGKDPAIILPDADLARAVPHIIGGAFGYAGQRCTAIKRVIAVGDTADRLVPLLQQAMADIPVGNPFDDPLVTPLISKKAADYVQSLIDDARAKGADVYTTGKRQGNLLYPTLCDHVTEDMALAHEEPFGPVLPVLRVSDTAEAVALANRSEYGLQASVFGRDVDVLLDVAEQLDAGTINLNGKTERGPDNFPFLGTKNSGIGVQGIRYALEASSQLKSIVIHRG